MSELEEKPSVNRSGMWYVKFVFAFQAAGLASWMLFMVLSLFIGGFEFVDKWLDPHMGIQMSFFSLVWSPLIWRRLR